MDTTTNANTNRITKLRNIALSNTVGYDEFYLKFFKAFEKNRNLHAEEKYGNAFYDALFNLTPNIADEELIVGRCKNSLSESEKIEWDTRYLDIARETYESTGGGQNSHMTIDYELVLHHGISGIIDKIDNYLSSCPEDKRSFYLVCKKCLQAVIVHSRHYADEAEKAAHAQRDPIRKKELETIAAICRKVPEHPAESFWEAVQSVHFITYCLSLNPLLFCPQQFQLGHPDRYLMPYFTNDINKKRITKDYARLLLDCLGIQINMRVPNGLSSGYMVGGRDESGNIVENELTYMCMQVIQDIRLVYPAVGLCYTEGMSDDVLNAACKILLSGRSHPAVFNDDIISKGLKLYGCSDAESHSYIHSTCVEITPVASSNVWVASPYTNMAQILLDCLNREYDCFDDLLNEFFKKLDCHIKTNFESELSKRKTRAEKSINPLLSCFVNDCLERGADIERGGARYNWIMPSFVGIGNVVDSLYVLKSVVFDEKSMSIQKIKEVLDNNFSDNEALRLRFLNSYPKYGNDIDDVDKYYGMITTHISAECKKYFGIFSNANIIPSAFCWIKHEQLGSCTGATPDGRKAGFPLGDGSGPCQGRELKGPTSSILSSVKWEHSEFIGGIAVNMKFSKKFLGSTAEENIKNLIKTYLKLGGFEIQINVIDRETLEKAVKFPESYRDLIVRIGGYSDYFVKLSPNMQREIIMRTEHKI